MSKHVDLISTLPDDLLCRIISLLPSKDAIRTTTLSSRWKNLMDFVPVLDLACHDLTLGFIKTLDKLLPNTDSSANLKTIQKLRLQISICHWCILPLYVNGWVRSAINHKVVDLDLRLPNYSSNRVANREGLALCVVASDSLQTLKIRGGLGLHMPYTAGSFKNLKTFKLWMDNPDKEILAKLFCGLPQLETLLVETYFSMIWPRDVNICINIVAPSLKWLSLCNKQEDYHSVDFKVFIDTPMLEYIYLGDDYLASYSVMSLPCLVEAKLNVGMDYYHADYIKDETRFDRAIELIKGLSNTKYLSVASGASAALDWAVQDLPILHGVTYLELDDLTLTGFSLIPKFLKSAPNLKKAVVTIPPEVNNVAWWIWISPGTLPTSLSLLEEFEITGAEIMKHEPSFNIMKIYIIEHAKSLKKFYVYN